MLTSARRADHLFFDWGTSARALDQFFQAPAITLRPADYESAGRAPALLKFIPAGSDLDCHLTSSYVQRLMLHRPLRG